jgi:hypothetical protein
MKRIVRTITCVALSALASTVSAQDPGSNTDAQIEELRRSLGVRDQVIRNLITRIEQLERSLPAATSPAAGAAAVGGAAPAAPPPAAPPPAAPSVEDQQLIRAAFERTLIDRGGLLLRPWSFELEPSTSYSHSSSENLVIDGFTIFPVLVVGDIFSERMRRDTLTTTLTARLGLPWRSQLEIRAPWVHEDISRLTGDGQESKLSDQGFGDLEIALSRDLPRFFGRGPQLLGSLRWKMATARDAFGHDEDQEIPFGSGFETLTASLTGVSVLDPVVFFGTLSFTEALAARKGEQQIDPGDRISLQLGMALALNLETSLSVAFEQAFTARTRLDGIDVPGTYVNTGTMSMGLSRTFPSGRSFDTSLAIGLSEDSPDLQLGFSMPFRSR